MNTKGKEQQKNDTILDGLIQISKIKNCPISKSTLYKWYQNKINPNIFVKIGGFLFIKVEELEKLKSGVL